jgi:hypothetical protein
MSLLDVGGGGEKNELGKEKSVVILGGIKSAIPPHGLMPNIVGRLRDIRREITGHQKVHRDTALDLPHWHPRKRRNSEPRKVV